VKTKMVAPFSLQESAPMFNVLSLCLPRKPSSFLISVDWQFIFTVGVHVCELTVFDVDIHHSDHYIRRPFSLFW
jgi:hypothetical protein